MQSSPTSPGVPITSVDGSKVCDRYEFVLSQLWVTLFIVSERHDSWSMLDAPALLPSGLGTWEQLR